MDFYLSHESQEAAIQAWLKFEIGVKVHDAITYAAVAAIILAVALAASVVPAAQAANVNPSETLRAE
jgi:ABC-type lipoprotein release transport system permease subunit